MFNISPLSSLSAILRGAYSTFCSTLLNLQYPNSIISMWKLSTDKVNAFSEQTCVADTKTYFGTKEYVKRKGNQIPLFLFNRISQFAKFCPMLSHEQRSPGLGSMRWYWSSAGQSWGSVPGLGARCPQNKPRSEFTRVAMQRVMQYLAMSVLGLCHWPWLGGVFVQLPENSWRSDLPLSF